MCQKWGSSVASVCLAVFHIEVWRNNVSVARYKSYIVSILCAESCRDNTHRFSEYVCVIEKKTVEYMDQGILVAIVPATAGAYGASGSERHHNLLIINITQCLI